MRAWAFGVMASVPELGVGLTATATLLTSRHEKSTRKPAHRSDDGAENSVKVTSLISSTNGVFTWTRLRRPQRAHRPAFGWHLPNPGDDRDVGARVRQVRSPLTMSTNHHLRHAQQGLRRIAAEWPADPLRPNLQLKTFLATLADHPALSARAVAATRALHKNHVSDRVSWL